jgi:hypothetical protein
VSRVRRFLWVLVLLLTACAETPEQPPPASEPVAAVPKPVKPRLESQPLKHLAGRNLKPQPTRPLNIRSTCNHRDAVGMRTRLNLQVSNAEVKSFSASVDIPKRGICRFDFKNFTQQEKLPQVLLAARDGSGCTVRMWEQERRTTIAFSACAAACENNAFDYLWPIIVETRSGRCF